MLNPIKVLICKIKDHNLVRAGTCPYTKLTYDYCERCSAMIPLEPLSPRVCTAHLG
jgi:hypothetical protein